MKRKMFYVVLLVSVFIAWGAVAFAQEVTTSGVLAKGFPTFVQDSNALQLGLCNVDNGADALGNALGPCLLDPGITNYWAADAIVESADLTKRSLVAMSISAIIEPGIKLIANEIVVRVRDKNGLKAGNYTVVTPYKTYTLPAVAGDTDIREVDGVETIISGVGAVPIPALLAGPVTGNLLTTINDTVNPPPAGFVGNGKELDTFHSPLDLPGPNGGVFRVTDPDGIVIAETNKFSIQGKLFVAPPATGGPDTVTLRSVRFNARRGIVTVDVDSSQRIPRPTFTVVANAGTVGPVNRAGIFRITGMPAGTGDVTVTVTSSAGGTAVFTIPVP